MEPIDIIPVLDPRWQAVVKAKLHSEPKVLPDSAVVDVNAPDPLIAALGFRTVKAFKDNTRTFTIGHYDKICYVAGPARWSGKSWYMESDITEELSAADDLEAVMDVAIARLTGKLRGA